MSDSDQSTNFKGLIHTFLTTTFENCNDNLASKQTIKYRMLGYVLREMEITFGDLCHLIQTHTPVHIEVAETIKPLVKQEPYKTVMAQDFIENEKLVKVLKHLVKNGHTHVVHTLLAMDGLTSSSHSKLNGPNMDMKRYVENLKYGLSGREGLYDRETSDRLKRAHVHAVRQVYHALPTDAQHANNMYYVLKKVLHMYTGGEQATEDVNKPAVVHNLDDETLEKGVRVYKANMGDQFSEMMEVLKTKQRHPSHTASEDEAEESGKKRKIEN